MIIDWHAHLNFLPSKEEQASFLKWAAKLGIDKVCMSNLADSQPCSLEDFSKCNKEMADFFSMHRDQVLAYCYINPSYEEKAVEEFESCIKKRGFAGLKLYTDCHCLDPRVEPLIEKSIELGVPVLWHATQTPRRYMPPPLTTSNAAEIAELGRRFPEAMLILAHIGGGGDWEWGIKAVRKVANVLVDTSGSGTEIGMIEMAVQELGADRILCGTDNQLDVGISKIYAADISENERKRILEKNGEGILRRRRV